MLVDVCLSSVGIRSAGCGVRMLYNYVLNR
jgi:hypothetical protein